MRHGAPPLSSPAQPSLHGRQAASPPAPPALTLKPTATGFDDKAGAYTEWLVPEGVGRVRFDLVGGAGGAASSFTPSYLTDVTNASLAGGGAGAQLSGVLTVKPGDILRVWAGNGGVGSVAGAQPAFGGEGYAAGGDSTGSSTATGSAQTVGTSSGYVYGASGGGSSAVELVRDGAVTVVAVAGAGGGGAQLGTLTTHQSLFDTQPNDQLNPALRVALDSRDASTTAGGSAGGDLGTDNTGQGGMLMASPYQEFMPLDEDDKTLDMRFVVTGGTAGRSGAPGTLGEALAGVLDENNALKLQPMSEAWFEAYSFPRYYLYEGDSVHEGEKGTGGADATGSYRGKGGSGALLSHTYGRLSITSVASGGGAGYGGGGAGLNFWTIGAYYESVFGRQVQFESEGNIYSLSSLSSGGGAGGSYINHEVVSDFALATAQNANPTAGVRSPGSAALYSCTENATLNTPITEGA
nr:transcriptional initiation protein Tat [uncultured Rothia sp.]